jgi:hypothetical protein
MVEDTEAPIAQETISEYTNPNAGARPSFWDRVKGLFMGPRTGEQLKIVLPSFLLFFGLITALRIIGNGPLFWSAAIAGGVIAYYLLTKSNFRRYVTVDLYRAALIVGLIVVMNSAVGPWSGSRDVSSKSVEVQRPVANIRESATTDSRIVTTASQGDKLTVLDQEGAWYNIKTKDGQTGWVYASLVEE